MKETITTVVWEEYGYTLEIVVTDSILTSRHNRADQIGCELEGDAPAGLHSYDQNGRKSFIFLKPNSTAGTAAHEALHMVARLFRLLGAKLSNGSEELYAYNIGYVTDLCMQTVKKWKPKKI